MTDPTDRPDLSVEVPHGGVARVEAAIGMIMTGIELKRAARRTFPDRRHPPAIPLRNPKDAEALREIQRVVRLRSGRVR